MTKKKRKVYKKIIERFKNVSLLNFSFVMIYINHKMLILLKNHLNFLNIVFSNAF